MKLQEQISKELDKRINKDLIIGIYEVRTIFNLTYKEFFPYWLEWYSN